tara:strand:+ start:8136 stop:8522 length:387 start_codon:yes stop_codon:yes gene_type:complete
MFGNKSLIKERDELREEVTELKRELPERDQLREEVRKLKDDIAGLKSKKKIEEEDIKHMVRLKEERMEVANEKKSLEMEREKDKAIAEVKDNYRDKLEGRLEKEVGNMKEMYGQILERLPNINVKGTI